MRNSFIVLLVAAAELLAVAAVAAWLPEFNLTPTFAGAGGAAIAVGPSGRIHAVYAAQPSGQQLRLFYRYLNGTEWSDAVDLPGPNHKEPGCNIVVDANERVHVVGIYRLNGDGPYTVHYWEYNGGSWTGPIMLSSGTHGDCGSPGIAVDRFNNLHVIWSEDGMTGGEADIMYRKRQGGVWQATKNVTANNPGTSYGSVSPWIAVDRNGNTVHVVWHDDFLNNGFQAYYTKNTNLGDPSAWLPSNQWFQLSTGDYGKAPKVFLDRNDYPNVWWVDKFGGETKVQAYRRWTGSAWTAAANWGTLLWSQWAAFDSGNLMRYLYVADKTGHTELYYRTYDYSNFGPEEQVNTGPDTLKADYATMALDAAGYPHVLWEERKGDWPGTSYIFYSTTAPLPPPAPVRSLTANPSDSTIRLAWTNPFAVNYYSTTIRYKIGSPPTGPTDGALFLDRATAPGGSDNFIHTNLTNGVTYCYAAFTRDSAGRYSSAVVACAAPQGKTVGEAKRLPDGAIVDLIGKVVTAVFSADGCIYVEEPDRCSGIRVVTSQTGLAVGDRVSVSGTMGTRKPDGSTPSERQVTPTSVTKLSTGFPLAPVTMTCRALGGAAVPPYIPGVRDGVGTNNIGLLVQICGRVTHKITQYVYVDDGSQIQDISGRVGVMVKCPSTSIPVNVGDFVCAAGIEEGSVPTGWTANRRLVHLRDWSDLVRVN